MVINLVYQILQEFNQGNENIETEIYGTKKTANDGKGKYEE